MFTALAQFSHPATNGWTGLRVEFMTLSQMDDLGRLEEQEATTESDSPLKPARGITGTRLLSGLRPWDRRGLRRRTSVPDPGKKFLTTMVLPRAGKGASITLLMRGWTRAGEMPRRFSTSSKICKGQKSSSATLKSGCEVELSSI